MRRWDMVIGQFESYRIRTQLPHEKAAVSSASLSREGNIEPTVWNRLLLKEAMGFTFYVYYEAVMMNQHGKLFKSDSGNHRDSCTNSTKIDRIIWTEDLPQTERDIILGCPLHFSTFYGNLNFLFHTDLAGSTSGFGSRARLRRSK